MNTWIVRALFSIVLFFAYIVIWASFYTYCLHGQFRFPSIYNEVSYKLAASNIEHKMMQLLTSNKEQLDWLIKGSQRAFNNKKLNEIKLSLAIADISESKIRFEGKYWVIEKIELECLAKSDNPDPFCAYFPTIEIDAGNCVLETRDYFDHKLLSHFYCMGTGLNNEEFFSTTKTNFGLFTQNIDRQTMSSIDGFTRAETHLEEGLFLRMIYLSAVTATTVGYGDIVPITTTARLSIALQAVLGMIMIGGFVSWIARV